ncbi:MAG: PLP-dependent aminotransferase family protein [Synergistaceae bacterium]|jgi:2-aminoadipate transaminase|nr:PLP-dependent aminotransferase family protein [Synergistaceae bacterium]
MSEMRKKQADFAFREQVSTMARERMGISEIGEMISLVLENGALSFGAGEPSADMFPKEQIRDAMTKAFGDSDVWGYHHDEFGLMELREWIAGRMSADDMLPAWADAANIIITNGGGEAMSLVTEALVDPGALVLVESPTYTESLLTFRKQGAVCVSIASDDDGIIPDELARVVSSRKARFLYTIPNFQNPSGRTTPLDRRLKILEILRDSDVALVEDDPYHYLSYDGCPLTSYIKLAGDDKRVIHCSSFSKIIAPGLRAGWAVIPDALIDIFCTLRISSGLGRPLAIQKGIWHYLSEVDFAGRVEALRAEYRGRRGVMLDSIEKHLTPLGIKTNRPAGGFFIWGNMPAGMSARKFAHYAVKEEKIGIIPGTAFYPSGEEASGDGSFRMSYAKVSSDSIDEGMTRLARAFRVFMSR